MKAIWIVLAIIGWALLLAGPAPAAECIPQPERPCITAPPNDGGSNGKASPS